jgi:glycosyltransferase involved in cell wall biosynthesis
MIDTELDIKTIAALIRKLGCEPSVGPPGEGWEIQQNPEEFAEFAMFCIQFGVRTVLELGTGRTGGLARFMSRFLDWRVTSVDVNAPKPAAPDVEFVQGSTAALYPYLQHRQFDLVFIDADHDYRAVQTDHKLYGHLGRIIAFHDIAPGRRCCPGTIQYWTDIAYQGDGLKPEHYEAIAAEANAGIGWYVNRKAAPGRWKHEEWGNPLPEATPDITVVSGTYNRCGFVQAMVESARASVPRGFKLDFVLVDGGSEDGTIEWARTQPDVTLIEHGELRGAIKAFCDGAQAATGRYVILANDDITFEGDAIFKAFCHLEKTPSCGAVAFAFDEPDAPRQYKTNVQPVVNHGEVQYTTYAQVGMYPRWLGEAVDWWGADDPDFPARTYGGDNYLASRILESGYTIDTVDGAIYHDHLVPDRLREVNNHVDLIGGSHPDTLAWQHRFNGGRPEWKSAPLDSERKELLRILYVPIYDGDSEIKQKERIGWLRSLQKIGAVVEVDYRNYGRKYGKQKLLDLLLFYISEFQPDLCITQVHTPDLLTADMLVKMRAARPSMVVVNWNGDEYVPSDLPAGLAYMKLVDLQLIVNGAAFAPLLEHGIKVAYQFDSFQTVDPNPDMPAHDVVFLGNAYREERWELERALRSLESVDVGLYGRGWNTPDGDTLYHYSASYGLYEKAKLAVVDNMYSDRFAYVSDRTFLALAHAQCVLWKACPGAQNMFGLRDGTHYIGWTDLDDLAAKIREWLKPERSKARELIGESGRLWTRSYHTYDARTRALLDTLKGIKNL